MPIIIAKYRANYYSYALQAGVLPSQNDPSEDVRLQASQILEFFGIEGESKLLSVLNQPQQSIVKT